MYKDARFWMTAAGFCIILSSLIFFAPSYADDRPLLSRGQTVYVPAYSHIYSGNRAQPFALTVTLSIRNVDPAHGLTVTQVDFYNSQGELLRKYLEKPVTLKPLETIRYIVPERNDEGGSGASFIVAWQAGQTVNAPIVESIMIGTQNQQGVSFTSRGRVINVLP